MGNRLTILIVDDIAINREILKDIFKDEYKVVEAEDGLGALEVLRGRQSELRVIEMGIRYEEQPGAIRDDLGEICSFGLFVRN